MNTHAYLALCALHPFAVEVFAAPKVTDIGVDGLSKRDECRCAFPQNAGLVAITPNAGNAGWAMSPDQHCSCGTYCPYACPSGFLPSQWNPDPSAARMVCFEKLLHVNVRAQMADTERVGWRLSLW